MDRGNENPTQHLFSLTIEENQEKTQSGWSTPGFEPGTSRILVACVTMEPPRSVNRIYGTL